MQTTIIKIINEKTMVLLKNMDNLQKITVRI